jgi:hypothetical protein
MGQRFSFSRLCLITLAGAIMVTSTFAGVPASYKGKPYKGPKEIPGRIFWALDYDIGGQGVSWNLWTTGEEGKGGTFVGARSSDGESSHMGVYQTNTPNKEYASGADNWEDGTPFPSKDSTNAYYYVGCNHEADWYCVTINVKYKGVYWLSSAYAQEAGDNVVFKLGINDVYQKVTMGGKESETVDVGPTPAPQWHTWKKFDKFGTIALDTGVQVLKFYYAIHHINNCYLDFSPKEVEIAPNFKTSSPTELSRYLTITPTSSNTLKNIEYSIGEAGFTTMGIYDCAGREIMPILNQNVSAGRHNQALNLTNVTNGVYFIRLTNNNQNSITKLQYTR